MNSFEYKLVLSLSPITMLCRSCVTWRVVILISVLRVHVSMPRLIPNYTRSGPILYTFSVHSRLSPILMLSRSWWVDEQSLFLAICSLICSITYFQSFSIEHSLFAIYAKYGVHKKSQYKICVPSHRKTTTHSSKWRVPSPALTNEFVQFCLKSMSLATEWRVTRT